jgi:MFS superfamily sulfate permease-like transporter
MVTTIGSDTARGNPVLLDVMYGLVNVVILAPVCVSFTNIIFSHPFWIPYLPLLVKLVMFSSCIHQACFSLFSTLPFAVGQVQDAGLIFLSSMAYTMVESLKKDHESDEVIIATVLAVLAVCTFTLGIALIIIGRLKFAVVVQYIPVPVIGGYLAFIGFFCGKAGFVMMTGLQTSGLTFIKDLFGHGMVMLWFPGFLLGVGMYMSLRTFSSPYVLPIYMACMLLLFYSMLFAEGMSLEDARESYLIAPLTKEEPFYESWNVYNLDLVRWNQLPSMFTRWLGMFLVVAFSSSLDVAAIEMELNKPLDYNKELQTVGISNALSGLLGGYTGSYIFSQTIFSMRRKVNSRVCGMIIAASELIIITFPFSITSYLPRLFFGAFLTLIAIDLMYEWLWVARKKIMGIEFTVTWMAFISMQFWGVEAGLVLGILFSTVGFVFSYAKTTAVEPCFKSSTVVRTFNERALLIANKGKLVTLSLQGHIFFGSAMKILEDVKSRVNLVDDEDEEVSISNEEYSFFDWWNPSSLLASDKEDESEIEDTEMVHLEKKEAHHHHVFTPSRLTMKSPKHKPISPSDRLSFGSHGSHGSGGSSSDGKGGYGALAQTDFQRDGNLLTPNRTKIVSTEYLVLDFEKVFGVDTTATRSCFLMLVQLMAKANVVVVFTNMKSEIERRLRAAEVINDNDIVIPLLDDALEWCEEHIITKYGDGSSRRTYGSPIHNNNNNGGGDLGQNQSKFPNLDVSYYADAFNRRRSTSISRFDLANDLMINQEDYTNDMEYIKDLKKILEDYLGKVHNDTRNNSLSNHILSKYFDRNVVPNDHIVFDIRQASSCVYFLQNGEIELVKISTVTNELDRDINEECIERVNKINSGGIFGEAEFILNGLHSTRALTLNRNCIFWTLSRNNMRIMEVEHPQLCMLVQHILLKSISISVHNAQ